MKIVLDTNVLVAALVARGTCSELVDCCAYYYKIIASKFILQEFRKVLSKKIKFSRQEVAEAERILVSRMHQVETLPLFRPMCRDPEDDWILSAALAGEAQCVITGDQDLLILKKYEGINILQPGDFWKYENREF